MRPSTYNIVVYIQVDNFTSTAVKTIWFSFLAFCWSINHHTKKAHEYKKENKSLVEAVKKTLLQIVSNILILSIVFLFCFGFFFRLE